MKLNLFLIVIIILQGKLENNIAVLGYLDELILAIFFVVIFLKYTLHEIDIKFYRIEIIIFILTIIFFLLGIISNLDSDIINNYVDYIVSGILSIKNILIYFLARIMFRDEKIMKKDFIILSKFLNLILNIHVLIIILDIPFNFLESQGIRFNIIKTVAVGFNHAAELDFMAIAIMVLQLFIFRILHIDIKKYNSILIKTFIVILFSGRTKGILFYIIYIILLSSSRLLKKFKLIYLIPFFPVILMIAKDRIFSEFLNENSVRGTLYKTGFKIAKNFWPLGSGYGTFGSDLSRKKYSPLYYEYGLASKYGLSPDWPAYVTDSQWASILGETGFMGTLIYMSICILIIYFILNIEKKDLYFRLAICSLWIYGLISSISDTIFITYRGVAISIITALMISILKNNKNII